MKYLLSAEEIAEIDRKIQKLENRINGYSEMRADGDITREIFLKKMLYFLYKKSKNMADRIRFPAGRCF
jgi:hypothetical protein